RSICARGGHGGAGSGFDRARTAVRVVVRGRGSHGGVRRGSGGGRLKRTDRSRLPGLRLATLLCAAQLAATPSIGAPGASRAVPAAASDTARATVMDSSRTARMDSSRVPLADTLHAAVDSLRSGGGARDSAVVITTRALPVKK